ncbi:MAG: heavy-metal-associated domain-containing protein [Clostridia bacterium]|nr:heavy-metal-associated domain-containing protein [Clostridia bacterium]
MEKITLKVDGMMCMHCVQSVEDALKAQDGISNVEINLQEKTVSFDADAALKEKAVEIIEDLGFEVK